MFSPRTQGKFYRRASGIFTTILAGPERHFVGDFYRPEDAAFFIHASTHFDPAIRALRDILITLPSSHPMAPIAQEILSKANALYFEGDHVSVIGANPYSAKVIRITGDTVEVQAHDDGRIYMVNQAEIRLLSDAEIEARNTAQLQSTRNADELDSEAQTSE